MPFVLPAGEEGVEPAGDGDQLGNLREDVEDDVRGNDEDAAEEDRQAILLGRARDVDVDRVAGRARERRIRVGGDEEVRGDVDRAADERGQEPVQAVRHAAREERREPGDDHGEERGDGPQRPARSRCGITSSRRKKTVRRLRCEIVGDDEVDRMRRLRRLEIELLGHRVLLRSWAGASTSR